MGLCLLCLLFVLFSSGWVATSNLGMTVLYFILLYFISFDCHLLESCSFLMRDRKGVDQKGRGGEGNPGDLEMGESITRLY